MKIQCPYCKANLQLGEPKPGRYKPTCKKCAAVFLIHISDDDPPKVRVGKLKSVPPGESSATKPSSSKSKTSPTKVTQTLAALEKTVDQTVDLESDSRRESVRSKSGGGVSVKNNSQPIAGNTPAPTPPAGPVASNPDQDELDDSITAPHSRLGGYRIVRMLGRGAMGAVYQARQISLDRDVALKTIRGRLADNPASLARFTREAYAAAQLSHHNVVQIYDFGEEDGQHYFSMEWVRGGSLGDLVREKGSLDPKLAATYILQAARGLQYAHRSGMVHRDIKPGNLLLSEDGVVKVADLGLVKIPDQIDPITADESGTSGQRDGDSYGGLQSGTQVTMQGTAVGTPAYMAPEQSADASTVDHRADIYSLGCSLFYLLAGRSPYEGTVVSEVIQQHARAPVPALAEINARVPEPLCKIVARAMAKRPADRYDALAEMIGDLQSFLGVESMTGFSPSSDQADRWESIAAAYAKTQSLKRHSQAIALAFAVVALIITVVTPIVSLTAILLGPTLFLVACAVAIAMEATIRRNAIADHTRRWLGTLSWFEISVAAFASLVVILVVGVSGLWIGVLLGAVVGTAAGFAYHFAVTVAAVKSGETALTEARRFLRDLRIEGADEDGMRDFLARYAGERWQSVYEALFGYDTLVETRRRLASDATFGGPTGGRSVRDRICAMFARKTLANREALDRRKLAKLEQQSLISQGVSAAQAREQSWQMASAIIETAHLSVDTSADDVKRVAEAKRKRIKAMLADARSGRYKRPRDRYAAVKLAFSGYSRLLAGCLLLAAFAFAAQSYELFSEQFLDEVRTGNVGLDSLSGDAQTDALGLHTSVWSVGIAGFFLCLSAFVSGWRMTPFAVVATIVILFGANLGIPAIGSVAPWMVAAAIGFVIYVPGIIYGEERP